MKKRIKRIISMFIVTVMLISMFSVNVMATGTEGDVQGDNTVSGSDAGAGAYAPVDTYVLDYMGTYTKYPYQYYSPYRFSKKLAGTDPGDKPNVALVYTLYKMVDGTIYPAFCIDNSTDDIRGTAYERLNLESSSYFDTTTAGKIRAILLNTYPNIDVATIQANSGIEGLTVAEIISATQIALYQTVHGSAFQMKSYYYSYQDKPSSVMYADICYQEKTVADVSGNDPAKAAIKERIKRASEYFAALEPISAQSQIASAASFTEYGQAPVVTANENGTYNVTVSASISVAMKEGDSLTVSAVMGDGGYYATMPLANGANTVMLTIENVPANLAYTEVKLAIDGMQTVDKDVFMFAAKGGNKASQSFAAIDSSQMPVHAEVIVIPPMEIGLKKTAVIKAKGADGQVTEKEAPLEGIAFDVYRLKDAPEGFDYANVIWTTENYTQYVANEDWVTALITDEAGNAYGNLTDLGKQPGNYLVVERSHPAIESPAAPVMVTLPYASEHGNVYRAELAFVNTIKESVYTDPLVRKDVTRIENNLDSYAIGEIHPWIIRGDIPVDIAVGKKYVISDTLDYRLSFAGEANDVSVAVGLRSDTTGESNVFLNVGEQIDYTVAVTNSTIDVSGSDAEPITSFEVELTSVGMNTVANIVSDKIAKAGTGTFSDYEIRVYFNAVIDEDAVPGVMIPNQAVLNYTNYVDYHFTTYSDIPQVYTCSLNIYKHDVENYDLYLNGATFKLARLATEAEINEGKAAPLVINDVTTYVVYETFYDKPISTSEEYNAKVQKVTTGAYGTDGAAVFYGIKEGDYYLIETKAPAGYNLMTEPIAVSVRLETMGTVKDVPNSSNFELPETGGIGTLIFTVGGAILIGAAILILLLNKKKQDKEDEK